MLAVLESTWRRVEPVLRDRVGAAVFDAWLAELRPLAMERGTLHLEAPNRLTCDRVLQFHRGLIEEELTREFGTRVSIRVAPRPESMLSDDVAVGPSRPVVDASNRTAWLVMQALQEDREMPSRLFLFHGERGTGKTFLLDWYRRVRGRDCRGYDGPGLVKAFQTALREQRVQGLLDELCDDVDIVIDEVHRVAGHARIQREIAKVLERRAAGGRGTLLASRYHPREIRDLEPVLETWLLAGFVTRLEPPSLEGRLAYLRALEGPRSQNGRADAIERLARDVQGGYPELRRAWVVDRHAAPELRSHYFELIDPRSTFERLRDRVADRIGIDVDELVGASQRRRVSQARKILAWLCVREGLSRAEVGRYTGRTRAAISYAIKSLEKELEADPVLRRKVEELR